MKHSRTQLCGCSSVVERNLAKVDVARSNRVTRFYSLEDSTNSIVLYFKGESGIRTHGNRKVSSDFKSDAFDQLCHLSELAANIF